VRTMKAATALVLLPVADAHSWLHCMKFLGDVPRPQDDETLCQGWPRGWPQFARNNGNRAFGQDIGRDNRPGRDVSPTITCDGSETSEVAYMGGNGGNGHGPRAIIAAGDDFVATWPAKNHCDVGAQRGCQLHFTVNKGNNPDTPDDFATPLSALGSGTTAEFEAAFPGLTRTYSKCTPQRGGVDRAFCYGRYTMPANFEEGFYGFMWWWEFNRGEHYNSCVGVQVVSQANRALADAQGTPTPPPPPGVDPPTPPTPVAGGAGCPMMSDGETNGRPYTCGNNDCTQFHNCCPQGATCYRKNQFYSGCRTDTCTPGSINNNDPPQFRTPWECVQLGGVCTEQTRANSVMAMGMEMNLFMANAALDPASSELGGMDPKMAAYQEAVRQVGPVMAAQIVGMDPAMMPPAPVMPPVTPVAPPVAPPPVAPVAPPVAPPPVAPVAPPVAPVAPPVAPVAQPPRPPVARPPVAVAGAYKAVGSLVLPVFALLRW